MHSKQK